MKKNKIKGIEAKSSINYLEGVVVFFGKKKKTEVPQKNLKTVHRLSQAQSRPLLHHKRTFLLCYGYLEIILKAH